MDSDSAIVEPEGEPDGFSLWWDDRAEVQPGALIFGVWDSSSQSQLSDELVARDDATPHNDRGSPLVTDLSQGTPEEMMQRMAETMRLAEDALRQRSRAEQESQAFARDMFGHLSHLTNEVQDLQQELLLRWAMSSWVQVRVCKNCQPTGARPSAPPCPWARAQLERLAAPRPPELALLAFAKAIVVAWRARAHQRRQLRRGIAVATRREQRLQKVLKHLFAERLLRKVCRMWHDLVVGEKLRVTLERLEHLQQVHSLAEARHRARRRGVEAVVQLCKQQCEVA